MYKVSKSKAETRSKTAPDSAQWGEKQAAPW